MKKTGLSPAGSMKRKALTMSAKELVQIGEINSGASIPVIARPALEGVKLSDWASNNREIVDTLLLKHRAILFSGFHLDSTAKFDGVIKATSNGQLLEYRDRSSPRHEVADKVYTSTDYPADQKIVLHNEGTYWLTWPRKIYFCCLTAPERGGETPIADVRRVYQRIDPRVRDTFIKKRILYVRNYNDGLGLSWQEVFQTTDKAEVEAHCLRNSIVCEWKSGGRLRTRQVREAVAQHPETGEMVWFNHAAFFHVSTLEPTVQALIRESFNEEDLPHNTYYGDGSPIEPAVLEELRGAYLQEKVKFQWQEGDVLLLDNMSVAHGRESFVGGRKVVVAMAEPYSRGDS
jgi:alpha-ketoglutarate-dependent taurine dioxygenase